MREARTYEEFIAQAAERDPERAALMEYKYPVLSDRQMRRRSEDLEVPFSQLPESVLDRALPVGQSTVQASDTVRLGRASRRRTLVKN